MSDVDVVIPVDDEDEARVVIEAAEEGGEENPPENPSDLPQEEQLKKIITQFAGELESTSARIHDDMKTQSEETRHTLTTAKRAINTHLQTKHDNLTMKSRVMRLKHQNYKGWYDSFQISIIFASTGLTLLETVKGELKLTTTGSTGQQSFFTLLPVFLSSSIAVVASVLKFKGYQEKMEAMQRVIDESIAVLYQLRQIQENVRHATCMIDLETLRDKYVEDVYVRFSGAQENCDRNLRYSDLVKHMKTYHRLRVQFRSSEQSFQYAQDAMKMKFDKRRQDLTDDVEDTSWCGWMWKIIGY